MPIGLTMPNISETCYKHWRWATDLGIRSLDGKHTTARLGNESWEGSAFLQKCIGLCLSYVESRAIVK